MLRLKQKGQGLVEFALILIPLLMLVLGIIEAARVFHAYLAVQHSAREAARYAVTGRPFDEYDPNSAPFEADDATRAAAIKEIAMGQAIGLTMDDAALGLTPTTFDANLERPYFFGVDLYGFDVADEPENRDDPGQPGLPVRVRVVYNLVILDPLYRAIVPQVRLVGHAEMVNEGFQVGQGGAPPPTFGPTSTFPAPATATPTATPEGPYITLDDYYVEPNDTINIYLHQHDPDEDYDLYWIKPDLSEELIGTVTTDSDGNATFTGWIVPADSEGGTYTIFSRQGATNEAGVPVQVQGPTPTPTSTATPTLEGPTPTPTNTPEGPYIALAQYYGIPGEDITIQLRQHAPNTSYDVYWIAPDGTPTLIGTCNTNSSGDGVIGYTVPGGSLAGTYTIESREQLGGAFVANVNFQVLGVTPTPTVYAPPDLIITDISVSSSPVVPGVPVTVTVQIRNDGGTVNELFDIDLYIDPETAPTSRRPGLEKQWQPDLAAGATATLVFEVTFYGSETTHQLWGQVDTTDFVDDEDNEDNNISGPVNVNVTLASECFFVDDMESGAGSWGPQYLVFEAEDFSNQSTAPDGHSWELRTSRTGASGGEYMKAVPDSGTNRNTGYTTDSPGLEYLVDFPSAGTYYIWVRGWGVDGSADSVHAGLNGNAIATCDRINNFNASWSWHKDTMDGSDARFDVPSAGVHTVNFWMREDGFEFDMFVLTQDSNYKPSGFFLVEPPSGYYSSGSHAWWADDVGYQAAATLDTPSITIPITATDVRLGFWHNLKTENNYDGGWLQYRIDGGPGWQEVTADMILQGVPYTGRCGSGCPSGRHDAWENQVSGQVIVAVPDAAIGHDIEFRWRFECDYSAEAGGADGWWIDDVSVCAMLDVAEPPVQPKPPGLLECAQLIENGDFEYFDANNMSLPWQHPVAPQTDVSRASPSCPAVSGGTWALRLNANTIPGRVHHPWLYQDLSIPDFITDTSTATLDLWRKASLPGNQYAPAGTTDPLYVVLKTTGGVTLTQDIVVTTGQDPATCLNWSTDLFADFNPRPYAGGTLRLHFYAPNDGTAATWFFLDNVECEACTEQPIPPQDPTKVTIGGPAWVLLEGVPRKLQGIDVYAYTADREEVYYTYTIQDSTYHFYWLLPPNETIYIYAEAYIGGSRYWAQVVVDPMPPGAERHDVELTLLQE